MAALAQNTAELRMLTNRDDRSDRKRSLQHFTKILFTNKDSVSKTGTKDELYNFFTSLLTTPIIELCADEAEKCRELTLKLVEMIVKHCDNDFTKFADLFVPGE